MSTRSKAAVTHELAVRAPSEICTICAMVHSKDFTRTSSLATSSSSGISGICVADFITKGVLWLVKSRTIERHTRAICEAASVSHRQWEVLVAAKAEECIETRNAEYMQSMYINLTRTFPDLDFPKEEMYGCFSHKSREAGKRYPTECDRCYRFQPVFYFQQQFPTRCILCDLDQRVQDYCEYIAPRASRPHSQKELESEVLNKVWFEQFSPWKEAANRTLNTARQPLVSEREIRQINSSCRASVVRHCAALIELKKDKAMMKASLKATGIKRPLAEALSSGGTSGEKLDTAEAEHNAKCARREKLQELIRQNNEITTAANTMNHTPRSKAQSNIAGITYDLSLFDDTFMSAIIQAKHHFDPVKLQELCAPLAELVEKQKNLSGRKSTLEEKTRVLKEGKTVAEEKLAKLKEEQKEVESQLASSEKKEVALTDEYNSLGQDQAQAKDEERAMEHKIQRFVQALQDIRNITF